MYLSKICFVYITNTVSSRPEFFNIFNIVEPLVFSSHTEDLFRNYACFRSVRMKLLFVLSLCGPLEVILHPSGLKTTYLHVLLHWVGCALFTRNKQSQGMNKLSQAALGIKSKVRENAEL